MIAFALAFAAEPTPDDGFDELITVYGDSAIAQARWDVILALKRDGWEPVDRAGGRTAFKPPRRWMGRARLEADGTLSFGYPAVRFQRAELVDSPVGDSNPHLDREIGGNVVQTEDGAVRSTLPAGSASLWVLPSRALLDRAYARVRESVAPQLDAYAKVRRDTAIRASVDALPGQLDDLWLRGVPLAGEGSVEGEAARRAAILAHWATRADTPEGRQATLVIEGWIRNTLVGEHAPTEEERDRAHAERKDGRILPSPAP